MMRRLLPGLLSLVAALGFSLWARPQLPERVATHWGVSGRPDGWSSATAAILLLPAIGFGVALLLAYVPRIDPKRYNFELHASTYWLVANVVLVFLAAVQVAVIGSSLGWPISMGRLVPLGVAGLFVVIGNVMTRMRPNWFMGIRTPWTLSSDRVWRKTHRVGGYCFIIAGVAIAVLTLVAERLTHYGIMVGGAVAALVPAVYSYVEWRRESAETQARGAG